MAKKVRSKPVIVKAFSTEEAEEEVAALFNNVIKGKNKELLETLTSRNATRQTLIDRVSKILDTAEARTRSYVDTGLSVIGRELIAETAEDLGLTWYRYIGGVIKTSRDFCIEKDGGYYHQEEIEAWPTSDNSDYPWDGMIEGTDSENIFSYCGGWNCRHDLIPVHESMVPDDVKGYNADQRRQSEEEQEKLANETPEEKFIRSQKELLRSKGLTDVEISGIIYGYF